MPFGNRVLNETIYPADANQWDTAYTKSANALLNTEFERILTPVDTSGTATNLTAIKDGFVLKDRGVLTVKLHVNIGNAATLSVNGAAAAGIYTSNGTTVIADTIAKDAIVAMIFNAGNSRWYILGGGGGGGVTATTLIDTANRRESFTGDGATKVFNFINGTYQLGANRVIVVAVSGIIQQMISAQAPNGSWRENSNKSIAFSIAPPAGAIIDVYYIDHVYGDNINLGNWS